MHDRPERRREHLDRKAARRAAALRRVLAAAVAALCASSGCTPTMQDQISRSIGTLQHVQSGERAMDGALIAGARGVAIIDEGQWALIVGGSHGSGVLVRRLAGGKWSAPCAITASSLSVGLSAGGEGRSVVVVFDKDEAVDRFAGKGSYFLAKAQGTFGGSHGHTDEPVRTGDDVHAFVVAEGVFASAALGSMSFAIDDAVNHATYGPEITAWEILDGGVAPPPGSKALVARLDRIAGQGTPASASPANPAHAAHAAHAPLDSTTPPATRNSMVVESRVETAEADEPAAPPRRPSVER